VAAERTRRGWSQSELARRAGVTSQLISAGEKGTKPHPSGDTLAGLARAFGISIEELRDRAVTGTPAAPGTPEAYLAALAALGVPPAVLAELVHHAAYIEPQDWEDFVALAQRRAEKKRAAQERQPGRGHPVTEQQGEVRQPDHAPDPPHMAARLTTPQPSRS
jgi:transcriptional regulator with XRE-family HTH domain